MRARECNYGACDPLNTGERFNALKGKLYTDDTLTGYNHVPPCPLAARCPECGGQGVMPRLLPSGADIPTCLACNGTGRTR